MPQVLQQGVPVRLVLLPLMRTLMMRRWSWLPALNRGMTLLRVALRLRWMLHRRRPQKPRRCVAPR